MQTLKIPERFRKRLTPCEFLRYRAIDRRQIAFEEELAGRGISFREIGPEKAEANYGKMSTKDFEAINARQQWANWILIGKCLHKNVPGRGLRVLDIGCGSGTSTTVLASYCPPGSHIIAMDLTPGLVKAARGKKYRCLHNGEEVVPTFVVHDATQPYVDAGGKAVAEGSIDFFNTSGIVGHHLGREDFRRLVSHATKVVSASGIAAIDEGPVIGEEQIREDMERCGWEYLKTVRIVPWIKGGQILFRKGK